LSAALALVDPAAVPAGLIVELADAEARMVLARRFHNDAVPHTLALRERRLIRLFRLAGTAALPSYFEIAERAQALRHADHPAAGRRTSARVVLLDGPARCCCCRIGPRSVRAGRWSPPMVVHPWAVRSATGVLGADRGS